MLKSALVPLFLSIVRSYLDRSILIWLSQKVCDMRHNTLCMDSQLMVGPLVCWILLFSTILQDL